MKCQYCENVAKFNLIWFRGSFGNPGRVVVPYCGACSLKDALAKRGMTAPVAEGVDYKLESFVEDVTHNLLPSGRLAAMADESKPDLKGCFSDHQETREGKYLVLRRDDTVPEWPWFVLGARDPMAAWALWFYSWVGVFYENNWAYLRGCNRKSWEFYEYRKTAGPGDPAKGRHRVDNPTIIARMRQGRGA